MDAMYWFYMYVLVSVNRCSLWTWKFICASVYRCV